MIDAEHASGDPDRDAVSIDAQPSPRSFLTIAGEVLTLIAVLLLIDFAYLTTRPVLLALVLAAAVASLAASELRPKLMAAGPEIARTLGTFATAVGRASVRIGIGVFLFSVALYYLLVDGPRWRERVVRLVSATRGPRGLRRARLAARRRPCALRPARRWHGGQRRASASHQAWPPALPALSLHRRLRRHVGVWPRWAVRRALGSRADDHHTRRL